MIIILGVILFAIWVYLGCPIGSFVFGNDFGENERNDNK